MPPRIHISLLDRDFLRRRGSPQATALKEIQMVFGVAAKQGYRPLRERPSDALHTTPVGAIF
jgi:hypothetical protein